MVENLPRAKEGKGKGINSGERNGGTMKKNFITNL